MEYETTAGFGEYVVISPTEDGLVEAMFAPPQELLPEGWPPKIRLPELGERYGNLSNLRYCQAVAEDAARLRERFSERCARVALSDTGSYTLPLLAEIYFKRPNYKNLSAPRRSKYASNIRLIIQWSEARCHPDVRTLSEMDVDDFLERFRHQDAKRIDLRTTWSILFKTAIYAGWIKQTPLSRGGWSRKPARQVMIWSADDVARHAEEARRQKQPGLAALIEALFMTGQRIGDMSKTRWDHEFVEGRFIFAQSKTGQVVNIPVPEQLRDSLRRVRLEGSPYVFNDFRTATQFKPLDLHYAFQSVRDAIAKPGDPVLYLKGLRHSCVCQMFRANASVAEIASVTGHLLARVHSILEKYMPDRHGMAMIGMKRAHLSRGGAESDFAHVGPSPVMDSRGRTDPKNYWDIPARKFLESVKGSAISVDGYDPDPEARARRMAECTFG